jgi:hypothetical protein
LSDNNTDGKADNNIPIATTNSNPNGNYTFNTIPVGSYVVVEINPPYFVSVKDFDPSEDFDLAMNSNMTNDTIPLTLTNNETDANNYFIDKMDCPLMVTNLNDHGFGSVRYNVDCAVDGDTIRFHSSLAGLTILLDSADININKDLTFISTLMPTVTISSSVIGLFMIENNATVEFRDLNVVSGNAPGNMGAAFDNLGILKLHNINGHRNPLFPGVENLIRNKNGSSLFLSGTCSFDY